MGRRNKKGNLETLATMPWPVGIAVGIVGFITVRYGIAWWLSHKGGPLLQAFAGQSDVIFAPLAWMLLGLCWIAALLSYLGTRKRQRFLDTRTNLDSLAAGGWRQFEQLVGEAFRRQGYGVEETGLGGPDGGIDLILRKDGQRTLVQCKQWKCQQVGVSVVREMAGLLTHHQAQAVKIVCIGSFTPDAEVFARGKPIELIGGEELLQMIHAVKTPGNTLPPPAQRTEPTLPARPDSTPAAPACPRCGGALVQRTNRSTGQGFLGCSRFPRCRGTG